MTPEELRRLAAQRMAEADELRKDAAQLRSQAGVLEGLLDPIVPMSQGVWSGPAAENFERHLLFHAGSVNEQARVLAGAATDFCLMAGEKQREAARLRSEAEAMEGAAGTGVVM